eukprot:COSAG05_NODE_16495_length_345_cov_0.422764_1_plen_67_part_01
MQPPAWTRCLARRTGPGRCWVLKQLPKCAGGQEADAARQQLASTREKSLATEQQLLGAAAVACFVAA